MLRCYSPFLYCVYIFINNAKATVSKTAGPLAESKQWWQTVLVIILHCHTHAVKKLFIETVNINFIIFLLLHIFLISCVKKWEWIKHFCRTLKADGSLEAKPSFSCFSLELNCPFFHDIPFLFEVLTNWLFRHGYLSVFVTNNEIWALNKN